jgi:hypothetical protein
MIGHTIERYKILEKIRWGVGVVKMAQDTTLASRWFDDHLFTTWAWVA